MGKLIQDILRFHPSIKPHNIDLNSIFILHFYYFIISPKNSANRAVLFN